MAALSPVFLTPMLFASKKTQKLIPMAISHVIQVNTMPFMFTELSKSVLTCSLKAGARILGQRSPSVVQPDFLIKNGLEICGLEKKAAFQGAASGFSECGMGLGCHGAIIDVSAD